MPAPVTKTPTTIGVLAPYSSGFYYGALVAGIQRVAHERGVVAVTVLTKGADLAGVNGAASQFFGIDAIDGWILATDHGAPELVQEIRRRGRPVIYLNETPHPGSAAVLPDNCEGMRASVRHLIEHGHRRIGFAGSLLNSDVRERYEGYQVGLADAGLPLDPELRFTSDALLELDGRMLGARIADLAGDCTAVACGTDKLALGIMAALLEAGIRVPHDVALIGFDDIENAQYSDPPLSTVRQPFAAVAARACARMCDHLLSGTPLGGVIRLNVELVLRKSCGCTALRSILPSSIPPDRRSAEPLETALLELAGAGQSITVPPDAWPGAHAIARLVAAVAVGDQRFSANSVGNIWKGFLDRNRDIEAIERAMAVVESHGRRWCAEEAYRPLLDSTLRDLRVELMRGWRRLEQERTRHYDFVAEANGRINGVLVELGAQASTDLSWMDWTPARHGFLALWSSQDASEKRTLCIVSEYHDKTAIAAKLTTWSQTQYTPADMPPPLVLEVMRTLGSSAMLTLAPVRSQDTQFGLLGIIAPIEVELLDHVSSASNWATHVAVALEREQAVSLRIESVRRDALTGLPNRASLSNLFQRAMTPENGPKALLTLDLDDFKKINDSLGHQAGDALLMEVAARLTDTLTGKGTLARLGGDEFAFLLTEPRPVDEIVELSKRIQEVLAAPYYLQGERVFSGCSIGIAIGASENDSVERLLRNANVAMHRAKRRGRNHYDVFHDGMHEQAIQRLKLDSRLRVALENNEFVLYYQPILDLPGRTIAGFEALLRWEHPERGCLPPASFLGTAEEVGLAVPISRWVIEAACRQVSHWRQQFRKPVYVNVNVPAEHIQQEAFHAYVEEQLTRHSIPGSALGIELVESSLIDQPTRTNETLLRLRRSGVRVAIDDFGTGYSSLSYLRQLPITVLKIDRSFVNTAPADTRDGAIVGAIITMAHALGLVSVAEGIETEEQLRFLAERGCQAAQGYLLGRPAKAAVIEAQLQLEQGETAEPAPPQRARTEALPVEHLTPPASSR